MVDSPGRGNINVLTFAAACVVGGSTTGLALAVIGGLIPTLPSPGFAVAGVIALSCIALLRDLGITRFWIPENRRQVRQTVLRLRPLVGDAMFGFELGTGARTFVPATTPYLVAVTVLALGDGIMPGLAAGVGFGLGRGLVVVDRMLRADRDSWDSTMRYLRQLWPLIALVMTVALLLLLVSGTVGA